MSGNEPKKALLFYNPNAGNGLFKSNLDYIIELFQKANHLVVPVRAAKGMMINNVLDDIDQKEYRQIIAAGGDGTINFCVNSMVRSNIDLPLAIFPAGTANDFAYYFEIPNNIDGMIKIALGDCFTYADVGKANEQHFVNVSAMGALVNVSQKTDPTLKNTIGIMAYYLKALAEIPNLKPLPIKITTPEQTYEEELYFMVVMNGISAGGFKRISPHSEINDGLLDVIAFRKMPILELGQLLFSVINGQHHKSKHVLSFKTKYLKVESEETISTDIDGEHGEQLPIEFSVLHNRLRIFTERNNL